MVVKNLYAWDFWVVRNIHQALGNSRVAILAWELVALTADGILYLLVIPILTLLYWLAIGFNLNEDQKRFIVTFWLALLVDICIIPILKATVKRHRPPTHRHDARFVSVDVHSFPSGHSTRAFTILRVLAGTAQDNFPVIKSVFPSLKLSETVVTFLWLWAMLVGFSRLVLGHHYPSDVIVGAAFGYFLHGGIALFLLPRALSLVV